MRINVRNSVCSLLYIGSARSLSSSAFQLILPRINHLILLYYFDIILFTKLLFTFLQNISQFGIAVHSQILSSFPAFALRQQLCLLLRLLLLLLLRLLLQIIYHLYQKCITQSQPVCFLRSIGRWWCIRVVCCSFLMLNCLSQPFQ